MSVLIKGIKMPKSCRDCPCYHKHYDSGWYDYLSCKASKTVFNDGYSQKTIVINPDKERLPNCPLVEIPPHGRLIDADALHEELNNDCEDAFRRKAISSWEGWLETMDALSKAPTIIEAEVKE